MFGLDVMMNCNEIEMFFNIVTLQNSFLDMVKKNICVKAYSVSVLTHWAGIHVYCLNYTACV